MNQKSKRIIEDSINIWRYTRLTYINLLEGTKNNTHIDKYLFDEIIVKEICTYMYEEVNIKKLSFLNEYMMKIWNNLERYCYRYNISFFNCEELFNFDQLLQ
jgi:hypothetical protein